MTRSGDRADDGRARTARGRDPFAMMPLPPMEARLVEALPDGPGWQFEPKWDGFRCIACRDGEAIDLYGKSGKPLGRYFPEVLSMLGDLPGRRFVLDGELAVQIGDTLSFDALQLRLHPAESRVRKLSRETPATFIAFDMPARPGGESLLDAPLTTRREALESFLSTLSIDGPRLSPQTRDRGEAERWLARSGGALDGVVAKRLDDPYHSGAREMIKVKRIRSADCVVGGFRYGKEGGVVGSLLLGLFDGAGKLHHVGFTSGIAQSERESLTRRVETLKGPPGFTGRAPGGQSRWSTARSSEWEPLKHELVVEVAYDQVTGDRFRHGTRLLRWRPDKAPRQCTFDQFARAARPGKLIEEVIAKR